MSSAQISFASAEVELVIHATEDAQKVLSQVESVIGIKPEAFAITSAKGHFGNEISVLKANLNGWQATELAYNIAKSMSAGDRAQMHDNFDLYLDEQSSLHVRINKQRLFEGKVELSQADALKIKFRAARRFQRKNEMGNYRKFLVEAN